MIDKQDALHKVEVYSDGAAENARKSVNGIHDSPSLQELRMRQAELLASLARTWAEAAQSFH